MDLTFRTVGPWGPGKGSNLQAAEVDENFWEVATEILNLQSNPAVPVGIQSITISGTQMTITLTDGTVMGPYTVPVLVMRWRDEWQPLTPYAVLDVFSVTNVGIFLVELAHTSGATFDPDITVDGAPALMQLFGSTDASLSGLSDVALTDIQDGDALIWDAPTGTWQNLNIGSVAYQEAWDVDITGGHIGGMPTPINPGDVATKAYVDALPGGATAAPATMMANITPGAAPAIPNTLTNYLDFALGAPPRGTLLYRGGAGWVALPPGVSGYFLKTLGTGADPSWAAAGAGVTSLTAGAGIDTQPDIIVATGVIALAPVDDKTILANTSGASAPPVGMSLSAYLDAAVSNVRGTVFTRTIAGWAGLAPGTNGYFLRTNGSGADASWDAPAGAGTVTSVATGAGLTGGPITGAGTISLASVANNSLLANITGASAAPGPVTVSQLLDSALSAAQGAVIYRSGTAWVVLAPGTNGQILTTGGAAANPAWANAAAAAPIANNLILGNISGSTAAPIGVSLTNVMDAVFGSTRGMILYRGATGWAALPTGTAGQVLTTGGTATDPSWAASSGTSISDTPPASPTAGNLWWDSLSGQLFIYYNDGSSSQWVVANSPPTPAIVPAKYNIGFSYTGGVLGAAQLLGLHKVSKAITIPAGFGAVLGHTSQAGATANATASTVISVDRALAASPNTFAQVGTITIAASGIAPTFATAGGAAVSVAQGDVIRLQGPATADATLANFYCTLVAQEL